METKRSAARSGKSDPRASTKILERAQVSSKRPSVPPAANDKRRDKSEAPPALHVANDNDRAPKKLSPAMGRSRLPTGSLHTEARVPAQADSLKQRLTALMNTQQKLGELKRYSNKHFYEIGSLLHRVQKERLFEAKGYGSFEAYVEREVGLGQQFCREAVRIYETFLPEAAANLGFARLSAAIRAMDDEPTGVIETVRLARSPIPPHKL
jgi:hypothetical protein